MLVTAASFLLSYHRFHRSCRFQSLNSHVCLLQLPCESSLDAQEAIRGRSSPALPEERKRLLRIHLRNNLNEVYS